MGSILIGILSFLSMDRPIELRYNLISSNIGAIADVTLEKKLSDNKYREKYIANGTLKSANFSTINNFKFILSHNKSDNLKLNVGQTIFANVKIYFPQKANFKDEFDEYKYCNQNGCNLIASQDGSLAIIESESGFDRFISYQISLVNNIIDRTYDKITAGIVKALILGDRSEIDNETNLDFSKTGTSHILSVSGLHITLIATFIFIFLGFINNKWLKFAIFTLLILEFVFLSGNQPSAIRAGVMSVLFLLIRNLQRQANTINILSFTTLFSILFYPSLIFSVGFQLSVLSMFGIVFTYNEIYGFLSKINTKKSKLVDFFISSFSMSLSASVIVSILVVCYFNIFSAISVLANLIIVPSMSLGMVFSILSIVFSFVSNYISNLFAITSHLFISFSLIINTYLSEFKFAYFRNEIALLLSFSTLFIVYLLKSNDLKLLLFRFVFVTIFMFLSFMLIQENSVFKIYPRKQFNVIESNYNSKKYIIVIQRNENQSLKSKDFAFNNFISENKNSTIFVNSEKLKESILANFGLKTFSINLQSQKEISKLLCLNEEIYQINKPITK
ncbi:MAG: ComEC/Rec2 family competence protein [Candidatus Kapabacteria bacterium]|nr:ComEC/Rec2 family competence protein [Candidatus Kapabacteria bacterium]